MKILIPVLVIAGIASIFYFWHNPTLIHNWVGSYYDDNSTPQYQVAMAVLKDIDLEHYHDILDIGCGSGKITDIIAQRAKNAHIVGIDASESMIKTAREKDVEHKKTYTVGDAQHLNYTNEFDLVVSFSCIHWIKDKDAVFKGIARALKKGGLVVVTGCVKQETDPILQSFMGLKDSEAWRSLLADVHPEQQLFPLEQPVIEKNILDAGLTPLEIKEHILPIHFKNVYALGAWLKGWFGGLSFLAQLPRTKQLEFLKAFVEQYTRHVPMKKDGSIDYQWPYLVIKATKVA